MSIITDKIDQLLKRNGILKKDFYAAVGISPAAYSQWKLGQSQPTLGKLQRAADVLGVDLADIISTKNTMSYGDAPLLDMKKAATNDGDGLSDKELLLLSIFNSLPEDRQWAILRQAQAEAQNQPNPVGHPKAE